MRNRFNPEQMKNVGNEWAVAIALLFHFINGVIGINGISYVTIFLVWGLFALNLLSRNSKLYFGALYIVGYIALVFAVSFAVVFNTKYTLNYAMYFGGFGIVALLVGCQELCIEKTLSYINYIGMVGICLYLVRGIEASDTGYTMGLSYSMLPLLLSAVALWLVASEKRMLATANIILTLSILLRIAPRGIWICVLFYAFIFVFYCVVNSKDKNRYGLKIVLLAISMILITIFVLNLNEIILGVNEFVKTRLGLKIYALDKFALYARRNNLMNGRESLWETAYAQIKNSPIFGGGIGYYELFNIGSHSHNLILQVMCEAGLFLLIPTVFLILEALKIFLIKTNRLTKDRYLFLLVTCSCGIVPLFYSSTHWIWVPFWVFLGNLVGESQRIRMVERHDISQKSRMSHLIRKIAKKNADMNMCGIHVEERRK